MSALHMTAHVRFEYDLKFEQAGDLMNKQKKGQ
jgi:hypothetical protein